MKNYKTLVGSVIILIVASSCSTSKNISKSEQARLEKIFVKHPDCVELLLNNKSLLKINNALIKPEKIKKTILKLNQSEITEIDYFSNSVTTQKTNLNIIYYLVHVKTSEKHQYESHVMNGYEFLLSDKNDWLRDNPDPIICINGIPFKYEEDYKPFLEELSADEILPIDILRENSAMVIYNYRSVLILTTKYGQ